MVPTKDALPEDLEGWKLLSLQFPTLMPDTPESCPLPFADVMAYLRTESADLESASEERLHFLRTAAMNEDRYWLWGYTEMNGEECYVFLRQKPEGGTLLGLEGTYDLSPEQYLLSQYYRDVFRFIITPPHIRERLNLKDPRTAD